VTWFTAARHVLLTGAGFTQGYGGYLASEMWATIFRQPEILVIGQVKSDVIDREPLLHRYLELFEEVLKGSNAYVVTMGYGFRDQHINRVIFHAIEDHGLRLCAVTPEDVPTYRQRMQAGMGDSDGATTYGQQLWEDLYTYYLAKVEALCVIPPPSRLPPALTSCSRVSISDRSVLSPA